MDVSLADRVVEVVADLGSAARPRFRYGSGCVVAGRTVLTAAHVVVGANQVWVRGPDKRKRCARTDPELTADPDVADLALLELAVDSQFPALPIAAVRRDSSAAVTVEECHAVGYPLFKEVRDHLGTVVRDTAGVHGQIPVLSNLVSGLLTLQVTAAPRPLPDRTAQITESEWSGMSGAPVLAGDHLLGVVTEHAPREGSSALTFTPLTHLTRLTNAAQWWRRLGVADPTRLARLPARPAASAGPVPAQLPADVRGFTGRDVELAELDALVADSGEPSTSVVICAVSGTAGVGKTALAVHWAHRTRSRFPDGQLYVNLRGFDPSGQVMDSAEALRGFLDALGVARERLPVDLDAQAALYRSLLVGKRVLIVLDNARDTDQIRPLLPGSSGCMVVVTSRNQLTGLVGAEGAQLISLDLPTTEEARDLLSRRLGEARVASEPFAVDQIIASCARLPLALAIVAGRAVTRPGFALHTLASELHEVRAGLDALSSAESRMDVRAVFSWSYRQLSQPAARAFRLLGLHPGPDVSALVASSLTGVPPPRTRQLLAELAHIHLVNEHVPGRYVLHDLLKAYATELAHSYETDIERQAAARRMLDHYLHTAHTAVMQVNPFRDLFTLSPPQPGVLPEVLTDYEQAMAWFSAEHSALVAAIDQAAVNGYDTHVWQLSWTLVDYFNRRGHWRDWVVTTHAALDAARRLGDQLTQAHAHRRVAHAQIQTGHLDEARSHLQQAFDLYDELGHRLGQGHTYQLVALVLHLQGRPAEALDATQQARTLYLAVGNRVGCAYSLNAIGWLNAELGNYEQTLTYCRQALAQLEDIGERSGQADTWDSLGYAHYHLGHLQQAIDCYQRALDLYRELGERHSEAQALIHLGDARRDAGERDLAGHAWQQALAILAEVDPPGADEVRTRLRQLDSDEPSG